MLNEWNEHTNEWMHELTDKFIWFKNYPSYILISTTQIKEEDDIFICILR